MGGLGPQESVPTESKKPRVRIMLNSALMSHNAGAISHQNPCGLESRKKGKDKPKDWSFLCWSSWEVAGDRKHNNIRRRNSVCYVEVPSMRCVCGCWVAWIIGPDGEPTGVVPLRWRSPALGKLSWPESGGV